MKLFSNIIKHLSIKRKLMMLGMVTSTIAVLITCTGFVLFNIIEEKNDMINEMLLVSKILSDDISSALVYKEKDVVDESLNSLLVNENIILACVFDLQDKEFTRYAKSNIFNCSELLNINKKFNFISEGTFKNSLVSVTDIKLDTIKRGKLYIISSLQRINDKTKRALFNAILLFIIIIFISYFISSMLQKSISSPILELANVSYAVKSGDFESRGKYISSDEVGELTESFNNMLDAVQDAKLNLEAKVKKRTVDLEKAIKIKEDFLSNMSHEIRTPIHGIMNYAEFLVSDWTKLKDSQRFDFIKKLYSNSDRLLSLINNLLDLSKLEAKKMEFNFTINNINDLIKNAIIEVAPLHIEKDLKLELVADTAHIANFDTERILQVLRNLFSNAIKFTEKGIITITAEYTNFERTQGIKTKGVVVSVSDQGLGIPESEFKYIFDKFNQSANTKTGAGGTGLGLTICRDIIKAHKGLLWAENNANGVGAVFSFIIPVQQGKKKFKRINGKEEWQKQFDFSDE